MKRIIDRLMARQMRLMSQLGEGERVSTSASAGAVGEEARAAEQAALDAAEESLSRGQVEEAHAALLPYAESATRARTLTLLARMNALAGNSALAVQQLFRAEAVDPMDTATWRLLADALMREGRYDEELRYRRKIALALPGASASAHLDLVRCLVRASAKWAPRARQELHTSVQRLASLPDTTSDHLAHAAEAMYAHGGLDREALALYVKARPCPTTHVDVEAAWVSMADWCESRNIAILRDTTRGAVGRRPQIATVPEVIVAPMLGWTPVVDDGKCIFSGFEKATIPLHSDHAAAPLLMRGAAAAVLRLPKKIETVSGTAMLLGGHPDGMRHVVDFMGALAVAEHFELAGDTRIVVSSELQPRQLAMLSALGIDESRLLPLSADGVFRFESLIIPTRLSSARTWVDPMLPEWYRSRLGAAHPPCGPSGTLLVSANVSNLGEVAAALGLSGAVNLQQLSLRELIARYKTASLIVAPLGEPLSYMVLAAPGADVIALDCGGSPEDIRRAEVLATACGHRFKVARCRTADAATGRYVVPAAELARALAVA